MVKIVKVTPEVIEENINNVIDGKPLTIPLQILRLYCNFKEVIMTPVRFKKNG